MRRMQRSDVHDGVDAAQRLPQQAGIPDITGELHRGSGRTVESQHLVLERQPHENGPSHPAGGTCHQDFHRLTIALLASHNQPRWLGRALH
jgi:hypothetical protein